MKIEYKTGDATRPQGDGLKIIAHVCNNKGAWGAGFVLALSRRWKEPEESYTDMDERRMGDVMIIPVENDIIVANMIAQNGIKSASDGTPPIRYHALGKALQSLNKIAIALNNLPDNQVSLHMPRIGCGLAGGDWKTVEHIIKECITVPVTVYDLP